MRPQINFTSTFCRAAIRAVMAALVVLGLINAAKAEDEDPLQFKNSTVSLDFRKLGGADERMKPHGNDLMGDAIDLNSGGIIFTHTDVSLPGNSGLEVAIRRKLKQGPVNGTPHQHAFGDWAIELPMAYVQFTNQFNMKPPLFDGGCMKDTGSVGNDVDVNLAIVGHTSVPGNSMSGGLILDIPGGGTSGFPSSDLRNPADPKAEFKTSPQTTDFAGRCATVVVGPDGTKYKFGRHVFRHTQEFLVSLEHSVARGKTSNYVEKFQYPIARQFAIFLVTEVEDVHGNWVRYDYTNDHMAELKRIYSNDSREIRLEYQLAISQDPLRANPEVRTHNYSDGTTYSYIYIPNKSRNSRVVSRIIANNQEYTTYSYVGPSNSLTHILESVTLPDGRSWQFGPKNGVPGTQMMQTEPHIGHMCVPYDFTFAMTHPDGAVGTFRLRETRHIRGVKYPKAFGEDEYEVDMEPLNIHEYTNNDNCNFGTWDGRNGLAAHERPDHWPVYQAMSLVSKKISVVGVPEAEWTYNYRNYSGGPLDFNWTTTTDPVGTQTTNRYVAVGAEFGLLKEVDVTSPLGASESFRYEYDTTAKFGFTGFDYGCVAGGRFGDLGGVCESYKERPMTSVRHARDGVTYHTNYSYRKDGDGRLVDFGKPASVSQWSTLSLGQGHTRITEYEYWNNTEANILARIARVTKNDMEFLFNHFNNLGQVIQEDRFGVKFKELRYHSDGTLKQEISALSRTYQFDEYHRGIPQRVTRPDSIVIRRVIDDFGRTVSETDANSNTTSYQYDSVGRLELVTPPAGWNPTVINYSNLGNGITSTLTRGGLTVTTQYDPMLRTVSVIRNGSGNSVYTNTEYDALGRVVFQSQPSSLPNPTGGVRTSYDGLGRLIEERETNWPHATTTTEYLNGNIVRVTDPMGNETNTSYSGYGSPTDGKPEDISHPEGTTTWLRYDIYGNLVSARLFGSHNGYSVDQTQHWTYDDKLRVCRHHTPETQSKLFAYNDDYELIYYAEGEPNGTGCGDISEANNEVVQIMYDSMGRKRNQFLSFSSSLDAVSYLYDGNGNVIRAERTNGAIWEYDYDELNNLTEEKLSIDGYEWTTNYEYDANGALSAQTYPMGLHVTHAPNGLGQPTQAVSGWDSFASNIEYHPNGSIKRYNYGFSQTYERDLNGRQLPSRISYSGLYSQTYDYDALGRITEINNDQDNRYDLSLHYDGLDRLIRANGDWGAATFTYDSLGNIRQKQIGSRTVRSYYNSANRISKFRDSAEQNQNQYIGYDSKGNMTDNGNQSLGAVNLEYDNANQPTRMYNSVLNATYLYDANFKRVKQTVNNETKYSFYSKKGGLLYRYDTSSDNHQLYISVAGQSVARYSSSSGIDYVATDHLGTNVASLNGFGGVKWKELSTPFGEKHIDAAANDDNVGFTGHVEDSDTGLTYMQARYYDPVLGRFLTNDPVSFQEQLQKGNSPAHGFNRYAYANNNPYKYTDPDGRFVNFALKFAADVAIGVALQAATGQKINVGAAVVESAKGVLNPAKTVAKAAKLAKALKKGSGGKGKCCFVAGTQVLTESGYKNIEDVQMGEKLWAKNTETGEQDWKPVTWIFVEPDRDVYEIKLLGADGFVQTIEATDDHPFYVDGIGWKTTVELYEGYYIETDGFNSMMVTSVVDLNRKSVTYNFTVDDFHTYYVTERNVLVHNCGGVKIADQKQKGHIAGTMEHQRRVDNGKPTSTFDNKKDADSYTKDTVATGQKTTDSAGKVTYRKEYGERVGSGPKGGAQTQVKVHQDSKGRCHGHPCGPEN